MDDMAKSLCAATLLSLACLAGCRGDGDASGAGDVRLPVLSQAKRPVLSDRNPPTPYSAETARDMGQPATPDAAPARSTASANRSAEPTDASEAPEADAAAIRPPGPLPIFAPDESGAEAAPGRQPASLREQGNQIRVVNAVVARVNDQIITREDLLREMRSLMASWKQELGPEEFEARVRMELKLRLRAEISRLLVLREARNQFNESQEEVLDQEVEKERQRQLALVGNSEAEWRDRLRRYGFTEQRWREYQKEYFIVQTFLHGYVTPRLTVTHREMLDHYEKVRQSQYLVKPQAHMFLVKLRIEDHAGKDEMLALARSLVAKARSGHDFADLARAFSKGPKAADGGDWGMMHYGSHRVEAVNEALATLPVGGVSDPIVSDGTTYIVKVAGRIEGRVVPFTEVQDQCRDAVRNAKRLAMVNEYIQGLYAKNHVEIYDDAL